MRSCFFGISLFLYIEIWSLRAGFDARFYGLKLCPKSSSSTIMRSSRRGLRALLETHPGRECCAEADSGEEAIRAAAEFKPDVIIMDVSMPGMGGVKATQIINETSPASRILLLTLHKSTELLRAGVSAGAIGYVLKSDDENELIGALFCGRRVATVPGLERGHKPRDGPNDMARDRIVRLAVKPASLWKLDRCQWASIPISAI
jgi:CheY-like chemotaxis protein